MHGWSSSCRLVYFGGYGHKRLTDVDSRNRSFIVDEASWVICHWCCNTPSFLLSSYLLVIWLCLQVEDVFWGWNNEVHVFDPMNSSWSEPKTNVSKKIFFEMRITAYWMGCEAFFFSQILEGFYSGGLCMQGRAPAPRAAHASATLGHRGYICGGRVMVSIIYGHLCTYTKAKWNDKHPSQTLFLNAGNQDEWRSLSGLWYMDMDRNVRHLKCLVNVYQICFWFSYWCSFQNPSVPHSSG